MLPAVVVISLISESGQIITAVIVSGRGRGRHRRGSAHESQQQIDRMTVAAVDPLQRPGGHPRVRGILMAAAADPGVGFLRDADRLAG